MLHLIMVYIGIMYQYISITCMNTMMLLCYTMTHQYVSTLIIQYENQAYVYIGK